ncbi:MAG: hypothetical protein A3B47_00445 [Candidatus Levybacteria bacterium RIFCSPLOWO2_01_FULL_39_24]|nr:MAG: hypothetical protein A2800_00745 [Candidatus Levybacteria bacterium RIFCSPHIGHO2_01_FULL_40_16]OGH46245.1 MAG: hypothetical protein A3B47_00445 [Candidatus Levybacteria bacterium RIFCSPLOWO2_01_FULL_39_24]
MAQETKLKTIKFWKIIQVILLLIIIYNFSLVVWQNKDKYLSKNYWQQYPNLKQIYYGSIYKNKYGTWVHDEILYSYIGGALIKGANPILLNPEVPPLGTYLIGASILIFSNQNVVIAISGAFALFLMYLIGKQIYSSNFIALLPPFFLSFEPIFRNQLVYTPLLDIMQLTFLLSIFYFFNKSISADNYGKYYLVTIVLLGFFISTKFFGTGIAVVGALIITLLLNFNEKRFMFFLGMIPLSIVILYSTYFRVLIDGYPFHKFLGIQKWIYLYNTGHLTQPFTLWPLLFLNQWHVWFGDKPIITDPQWLITWPIFTTLSLLTIFLYFFIFRTKKKEAEILFLWIVMYLILMSFVQISARYFVILIPILYLVGVYGLLEFIRFIKK